MLKRVFQKIGKSFKNENSCEQKAEFNIDSGNSVSQNFWKTQSDWQIKSVFRTQYYAQLGYITEAFLPLCKEKRVCDLACACGDYSFPLAKVAKHVDGFDLSPGMIETAKATADKLKITNCSFYVDDATKIKFKMPYDAFVVSGLFTCIFYDEIVSEIIKKIFGALNSDNHVGGGGVVLVKDSLITTGGRQECNDGKYAAIYRTKDEYLKLWTDNGFELKDEVIYMDRGNGVISFGGIFSKRGKC